MPFSALALFWYLVTVIPFARAPAMGAPDASTYCPFSMVHGWAPMDVNVIAAPRMPASTAVLNTGRMGVGADGRRAALPDIFLSLIFIFLSPHIVIIAVSPILPCIRLPDFIILLIIPFKLGYGKMQAILERLHLVI